MCTEGVSIPMVVCPCMLIKVLRLLKLNRQYRLSKVLWRTAKRVYGRIAGKFTRSVDVALFEVRRCSVLITYTRCAWLLPILAMTILLAFLVALFSIILYYVERGDVCFVGDVNGNFGDDVGDDDGNTDLCASAGLTVEAGYRRGLKFMIAKSGSISQFENVFTAIWFSFVTLTTTG